MKILQISDLHLGALAPSLTAFSAADITAEMWRIILRISDIVEQNNIDIVLIAGDLFDHENIESNWYYLVTNMIETILKRGKVVVYATGNHDYFIQPNHFKMLFDYTNFILFTEATPAVKSISYQNKIIAFYGVGYDVQQPQKTISDEFPALIEADYHFAIGHGEVDNIQTNYYNFNSFDMLKYDVFAIGHRHQMEIIANKILYAGSTLAINKNNIGSKGALIYDLDDLAESLSLIKLSKMELIREELVIDILTGQSLLAEILSKLHLLDSKGKTLVLDLSLRTEESISDFQLNTVISQIKSAYSKIIFDNINLSLSSSYKDNLSFDLLHKFTQGSLEQLDNSNRFYFNKEKLKSYLLKNSDDFVQEMLERMY